MYPATFNIRKVVGYLQQHLIFRRVVTVAKNGFMLRRVCPSVRPHGTTLLPLGRFS